MAKMPVLVSDGEIIAEATIIIEYLAAQFPGAASLIPEGPDAARRVRFQDRIYHLYFQDRMQRIVGGPPASIGKPRSVRHRRSAQGSYRGV